MKKDFRLYKGDNMVSLKRLPDNSIDSVVTDPPYGLSFMNKKWDYNVPSVELWKEVYRVLKPGGHVLSFGGTRTYHRMVVNIEDAGFEIRDQIMWLYGSGFPKSHNIGKQEGCEDYEGFGTALKPANEPICVARKPLSENTIAANVKKWGTGGINIDGCRIGTTDTYNYKNGPLGNSFSVGNEPDGKRTEPVEMNSEGRFPSNIMLDEEAAEMLDEQSGITNSGHWPKGKTKGFGEFGGGESSYEGVGPKDNSKQGASRYFYTAKVSKKERNMGLDGFEETTSGGKGHGLDRRCSYCNTSMLKPNDCKCIEPNWITPSKKNTHPTVKPVQLMSYLVRLVTPKNGIVLDPFMGSGSTGISTLLEGFRFCGMEMDEEYNKIAEARIENYESYREFLKKKKSL